MVTRLISKSIKFHIGLHIGLLPGWNLHRFPGELPYVRKIGIICGYTHISGSDLLAVLSLVSYSEYWLICQFVLLSYLELCSVHTSITKPCLVGYVFLMYQTRMSLLFSIYYFRICYIMGIMFVYWHAAILMLLTFGVFLVTLSVKPIKGFKSVVNHILYINF